MLISSESGKQRRITHPPKRSDDSDPFWSPDGTQIAFHRSLVHGFEGDVTARNLYVVDATGGRPLRLTPNSDAAGLGDWSPDGAQIAYSCDDGPVKSGICVINVDGTEHRRLTSPRGGLDGFPVWSPDGTTIAFVSSRDQLYVMDADGSGQRRVSQIYPWDAPVWLR